MVIRQILPRPRRLARPKRQLTFFIAVLGTPYAEAAKFAEENKIKKLPGLSVLRGLKKGHPDLLLRMARWFAKTVVNL
jgi:hypothetical protein